MHYPLRAYTAKQNVTSVSANENKLALQQTQPTAEIPAPALKLTYYPSHRFLEATWQRPVSSQEYRQAIRFVGVCVAMLRAEYMLADFSEIGTPTEEDERTTMQFLQKALQNTTLKRSARLLGDSEDQARSYKAVTENGPVVPYQAQVFWSATAARQWLFKDFENMPYETGSGIWIPLDCSLRVLKNISQVPAGDAIVAAPDAALKKANSISRYTTDFAEIIADEDKSLIILRWLRKVTIREHRFGILKAGRALVEKNIRFAVLNQQRSGVLTLEEQGWLANQSADIISRSKLKRLAIINSIDAIQQMASNIINLRIRKTYSNYLSEYFLNENDAMYWLFNPITDK